MFCECNCKLVYFDFFIVYTKYLVILCHTINSFVIDIFTSIYCDLFTVYTLYLKLHSL